MMKKFLVMLTVLAAISSATVLELSFNGMVNGPENNMAVTMMPSEYAMIDVNAINATLPKLNWDLTVLGPGTIAKLGNLHIPPSPNGAMVDYSASYPTYSAYVSFRGAIDTSVGGIGRYWDTEFHCDGPGVVVITLMDTGGNTLDTITISQIPEPMTVALLGLGGLFLRRRK